MKPNPLIISTSRRVERWKRAVLVLLLFILIYGVIHAGFYKKFSNMTYAPECTFSERVVKSHLLNKVVVNEGILTFESPWGTPTEIIKTEHDDNLIGFIFNNDIGLGFVIGEGNFFTSGFLNSLNAMEQFYLNPPWKSSLTNYQIRKAILSSTSKMFNVRNNPFKNSLLSKMITFKNATIPALAYDGIFSFETSNVSGFQFGNPNIDGRYYRAHLELYDEKDYYILINIRGEVTQEEIDTLIESFRIHLTID